MRWYFFGLCRIGNADWWIGNERREKLLAFADPENGASVRVLEKAGFQKGPLLKEYYERAALGGRKSDLLSFHLERLGV